MMVLIEPDMNKMIVQFQDNKPVLLFIAIADMFVVLSSKIMLPALIIMALMHKQIILSIRVAVANKIFGRFPKVESIVKKDKKLYLRKEWHTNTVLLIYSVYRGRSRRRVLDSYKVENVWDEASHFSLEWNEVNQVVVRHYDDLTHKLIVEKEIKLARN